MATSGVESLRAVIAWSTVEPARGFYDFSHDRSPHRRRGASRPRLLAQHLQQPAVGVARGLHARVLPLSAQGPDGLRQPHAPAGARYGPRGTFWTQNPDVPRRPIRQWQIWNEQRAPWFWAQQAVGAELHEAAEGGLPGDQARRPRGEGRGRLVRRPPERTRQWAATAICTGAAGKPLLRRRSPCIRSPTNPRSARGTTSTRSLEIVRRVRREMRTRGDAAQADHPHRADLAGVRRQGPEARRLLGLETTTAGPEPARCGRAYRRLASERRKLRVTQAYWFTWATQYDARRAPSASCPSATRA